MYKNLSLEKLGLYTCALMFSFSLVAQTNDDLEEYTTQKFPHKIFLELGGQGGLTLNYERFYPSDTDINRSLRLGFVYVGEFIIPVGFNFNKILNEYHQLSVGPGATFIIDYKKRPFSQNFFDRILNSSSYHFAGNLGYHYSNDATDLSIGLVITPVIEMYNYTDPTFNLTAGVRVGYHFE